MALSRLAAITCATVIAPIICIVQLVASSSRETIAVMFGTVVTMERWFRCFKQEHLKSHHL